MQTWATLVAEWVYEEEDGLEAFRVLELEIEDDHRRHVRMVWPELSCSRSQIVIVKRRPIRYD